MLRFSICAILFIIGATSAYKSLPIMPAGTYLNNDNELIDSSPIGNEDAPTCRVREPCGFYTFDTITQRPRKWIQSWCKCNGDQSCVYSSRNNRLRIYVHTCLDNSVSEFVEMK